MDQIYYFRIILRLQCILSYFQEKYAGFDRKKDFRSNLREEQRSDNAPNDWKKQDGRSHNRAEGQHDHAAGPGATHGRASAALRDFAIPKLFNAVFASCFGGHLGWVLWRGN